MHFVDARTHGFDYKLDFDDWYQYLVPKTKLRSEEILYPNSGSGPPQIDDLWRDYGDPWRGFVEPDDREGYTLLVGRLSGLAENFVARELVRFLKNFGKNRPFLLISSFSKPHDPFTPAERFAKMLPASEIKFPETWGKVGLAAVPGRVRKSILDDCPTPELRDPDKARKRIAMYYANLAQTDDNVGKILDALRELDLESDTIVLYTADQGDMLGAHGLWGKTAVYEPSVGVPLLVRVPGMTHGNMKCETAVSLVQIAPSRVVRDSGSHRDRWN